MNSCHERIFYYFTTTTHIEIRDAIEIVLRLWCDLHVLYSFHFLCFNIINIKKNYILSGTIIIYSILSGTITIYYRNTTSHLNNIGK